MLTRHAPPRQSLARHAPARHAPTRHVPPPAQHRHSRATAQHLLARGFIAQRHARRRNPREPQQALQLLMSGLGALIVTSIVVLSAFFIIADELRGPGGESAAPLAAVPQGIDSRAADAAPLTQGELFPRPEIRLGSGSAPYQVTMTHIDNDCPIATTGELGVLLDEHGCSQVVRAGLIAPFAGYRVTAGLFNLADENGAALVSDRIDALVESGRGSFAAMGGLGSNPLAEPLAQVAWQHRGHFLAYCVIARPDGQLVTDDDPYARRIAADLVEQYLSEDVVGRRTLDP